MIASKGWNCFEVDTALTMGRNFFDKGALCDPSPGYNNFRSRVNRSAIHSSDMGLMVVASSLESGQPVWFSKNDPDIIEGALASGAIAPAVFPHFVRGQWFVDGE